MVLQQEEDSLKMHRVNIQVKITSYTALTPRGSTIGWEAHLM
jgi:hypothetical protein